MPTTLGTINRLSEERFNLYRTAGVRHLTWAEVQRIGEIKSLLAALWAERR